MGLGQFADSRGVLGKKGGEGAFNTPMHTMRTENRAKHFENNYLAERLLAAVSKRSFVHNLLFKFCKFEPGRYSKGYSYNKVLFSGFLW